MRTAARFHRNQTAWLCSEELQQLRSRNTPAEKLMPCGISAMCLENRLRDI
jgi:hypothetical protein